MLFWGALLLTHVLGAGWTYGQQDIWGNSYPVCAGNTQSPIDLANAKHHEDLQTNVFDYQDLVGATLTNNGHSLVVSDFGAAMTLTGGGLPKDGTFAPVQFHFHWSSEHTLDGYRPALELHIVHYNTRYADINDAIASNEPDGLAVVGVFFDVGEHNEALDHVLNHVSKIPDEGNTTNVDDFCPCKLLPTSRDYFFYEGSLTTPPCSEVVQWTVFKEILSLSQDQYDKFTSLAIGLDFNGENYRRVQPLNGRTLFTNTQANVNPNFGSNWATVVIIFAVFVAIVGGAGLYWIPKRMAEVAEAQAKADKKDAERLLEYKQSQEAANSKNAI
jgi:carbonic anhydrase